MKYRDRDAKRQEPPTPTPAPEAVEPISVAIQLRTMRRQLSKQKAEFAASLSVPGEPVRTINWMPLYRFQVELAMLMRAHADAYERMTRQ